MTLTWTLNWLEARVTRLERYSVYLSVDLLNQGTEKRAKHFESNIGLFFRRRLAPVRNHPKENRVPPRNSTHTLGPEMEHVPFSRWKAVSADSRHCARHPWSQVSHRSAQQFLWKLNPLFVINCLVSRMHTALEVELFDVKFGNSSQIMGVRTKQFSTL